MKYLVGVLALSLLTLSAPLAHADGHGLVEGGTGIPTPTPGDVGASGALMDDFGFTGTPQVLTTPEGSFGNETTGAASSNDVTPLVNEVTTLEKSFPGVPLWVFGYSQSANVQSGVEAADLKNIPNLHFFQVGDAMRPDGGYLTINSWLASGYGLVPDTPANLDGIPTTSVCLGYDEWCDQPLYQGNSYATANASDGGTYAHLLYYGETPQELANASTTVDGSVTYVNVDNNSLPYLDNWIINTSGGTWGKLGDEIYDANYAYDKVEVDYGYGNLDTIVNGQVISPAGNEFNPGDPGTVTSILSSAGPSSITAAQLNAVLAQANTLDASNYSQMVNDTPSQLAAWDATGANPAFDAAQQMEALLSAAVDNGTLTAAQAATDSAAMLAGF